MECLDGEMDEVEAIESKSEDVKKSRSGVTETVDTVSISSKGKIIGKEIVETGRVSSAELQTISDQNECLLYVFAGCVVETRFLICCFLFRFSSLLSLAIWLACQLVCVPLLQNNLGLMTRRPTDRLVKLYDSESSQA